MRTYGKITWGDSEFEISDMEEVDAGRKPRRSKSAKFWKVECEPHVMIRLKRVFEGVNKGSHRSTELMDTPTSSHELLWFMQRFPMEVGEADRVRMESRSQEYLARLEIIAKGIGNPSYRPPAVWLPVAARDYQLAGADMTIRSKGLLVADAAGVGKTVTCITTIAMGHLTPALVVCYPHLMEQWQKEFEVFAPWLTTKILKKGRGTLDDLTTFRRKRIPLPHVIICNYEKLKGWSEALAGWARFVGFDECQELRKNDSDKYAGACMIAEQCEVVQGLTATPIYNYGNEIWNVMNVLNPGCLGSAPEFGREWCGGSWGDKAQIEDPKAFGKFMREQGLMIRRTRADVGRELPHRPQVQIQKVEADLWKIKQIDSSLHDLATKIMGGSEITNFDKFRASGEFDMKMRLQTGLAKAAYVADFVKLLCDSGEKVVLYGWHHDVYDVWAKALEDYGVVFFTGRESPSQKAASLRAFVEGDAKVICCSLRTGAGLNGLQKVSSLVVFGELDWSPGRHRQAIWRLDRDGQFRRELGPVMAYFLVAECGADPVMMDVLAIKEGQLEGITDPDAELVEESQVDPDHVKKLAEAYLRRRSLAAVG